MKKLLNLFLISSSLLIGFNDGMANNYFHGSIPEKVREKFKSMFADAKEPISWSETGGKYRADFVLNNKSISLVFKKDGELIDSKIEIEESELPSAVLDHLKKEYLGKEYKIIYIMRKVVLNIVSYEIEVMKGRIVNVVRYNKEGTITNKYTLRRWDSMNNPLGEGN
jgi:hypothetical protein